MVDMYTLDYLTEVELAVSGFTAPHVTGILQCIRAARKQAASFIL